MLRLVAFAACSALPIQQPLSSLAHGRGIQLDMAKTSPDQSQQFNSMLLTAIVIAGILAVCIVWLVYGCARETNHKPALAPPGMFAVQSVAK